MAMTIYQIYLLIGFYVLVLFLSVIVIRRVLQTVCQLSGQLLGA